MGLLVTIYSFLIVYFIVDKKYDFLIGVLISIPVIILICLAVKKIKIGGYTKKIKNVKEGKIKNPKPFINVNKKVEWYILELIPGIKRVKAKQVENRIRKRQKFKDFIEFANFCEIDPVYYEVIKKIITF